MRWILIAILAIVVAVSGGPTAASGDGGGGGGAALIQPQFGTIFWTVVTFVILLFVLRRFAWKPLLGAVEARESSIQESLDQARRDRQAAEEQLAEHRKLVQEAHRERASAMAEGRQDAESLKAEMLEEAKRQREVLLRQTQEQVDASMRQARAELRSVAVDLAILGAGKLLSKNLDEATQRKLVEEHLRDLESSGRGPLPS